MGEQPLPLSLQNCPIVGVAVEVRFESAHPRAAVFGIIYERINQWYPKIEALEVMQLPHGIVDADPNLRFKPHYKLQGNDFFLQVGPDTLSISPNINLRTSYPGWKVYYPVIVDTIKTLEQAGIFKKIARLGIRYSNFFSDSEVYKKLNLQINYNDTPIPYRKTVLRTELVGEEGFSTTLQISNNSTRSFKGSPRVVGSMIDIDTFKLYPSGVSAAELLEDVNRAHEIEKRLFWDLLKDDLKAELKPSY